MLLGDTLNVFIGLALTFAMVALLVSTLVEAIASWLRLRSKTLLTGLKDIFNDPQLTGFAGDLLAHGAVNPRAPGTQDPAANTAPGIMPSYISPLQFAGAFVDILQNPPRRPGVQLTLDDAIAAVPDLQTRGLLRSLYARSGGDLAKFHQEIADWFDSSMDRLSGTYKRYTQWISLVVAFVLAALLDIDCFHLLSQLWTHAAIVAVTPKEMPDSAAALATLESLPFGWGWTAGCDAPTIALGVATHFPGWVATAFAALFGAPFWFDTLQRFVQLRGTGTDPGSKPPAPLQTPVPAPTIQPM